MIDLTAMLINLSNSMQPVQKLLSGMGYLLGIILVIIGLGKLKNVLEKHHGGHQEGVGAAIAFILGGALLLYLPSSVETLSNTFFGPYNVLSYSRQPSPLYHALVVIIETTGLLWFIRGTSLMISASKPGDDKIGPKGFAFLIAGILAMNFESTTSALTTTMSYIFALIKGTA